jgi:hypothetical protein
MTHVLVPKEVLQQMLAVILDARTTDDSEHKWDRNFKAEKAIQALLDAPCEPRQPNDDEVICPNCTHQFRAIPVNVQHLMIDGGIEPPFKPKMLSDILKDTL